METAEQISRISSIKVRLGFIGRALVKDNLYDFFLKGAHHYEDRNT